MDKKEVEPRQAGRSQVPPNSDPRYKFITKTGQGGKERDISTGLDYFPSAVTNHFVTELLHIIYSIVCHGMDHDRPGKYIQLHYDWITKENMSHLRC